MAVAVTTGSATAFSLRKTPTYEASARVFIGARSVEPGDVSGALEELTFSREFLTSYAEVLRSEPVAEKVIDREKLTAEPPGVAARIQARVVPNTRIIEVKFSDESPRRAQRVTNALIDIFVTEEVPNLGGRDAVAAKIVQPATLPTEPTGLKPAQDVLLGAILGLALGVGFAFLQNQLDTTLRTREEVEEVLAPLPVLAGLPSSDSSKDDRTLFFENDTRSPSAEAIRTLRTNIQFFSVDNPIRVLVVTSPYAEDGKTTVAANLGASIAASGVKTILLEADLRRPMMSSYFDSVAPPERWGGLSDVLAGVSRVADVLKTTHIPNLSFMPAGSLPPNPSELLGSHRMEEVLNEVRNLADIVVIDTPPALAVTDALVLGSQADGVVFVVRAGVTHRDKAREAKEVFERSGVRLLGLVLNDLDMGDAQYYYRYYQRYTPRHRQMKQPPPKVTRPTPEFLANSGLEPSAPPKGLRDADDFAAIEAAEEVSAPDVVAPEVPAPEVPAPEVPAAPAVIDEVPEEKIIEAPDASLEEMLEEVEVAAISREESADEDGEEGKSLARLRALSRLLQDEDLLKKVSAADNVDEPPTFEVVDAPEPPPPPETGAEFLDAEADASFDQESVATVEVQPEPEPETELEIEKDPEPQVPVVSESITPLFPSESEAPAPSPSQPAQTNGPPAPPSTLDPEVLRMMREEEDEYEEDSDFAWVGEQAGDDQTEDDEESVDDSIDLEALGIDVTRLTPKQRKRLRKRIHRLGPEAATQDLG